VCVCVRVCARARVCACACAHMYVRVVFFGGGVGREGSGLIVGWADVQAVQNSLGSGKLLERVLSGGEDSVYVPSAASLRQQALQELGSQAASPQGLWDWCPEGAGSLLVQAIQPLKVPPVAVPSEAPDQARQQPNGSSTPQGSDSGDLGPPVGAILLFGNPASPPSDRDRLWARAIAGKLFGVLSAQPVRVDRAGRTQGVEM
jgi:hypothetical protein